MSREGTQYYLDSMIVATIVSDASIIKQANISEIVSDLIMSVKNYAMSKIDKNDKLGSVFNILAPGMLGALGFPGFSALLWLAEEVFDFNPGQLLMEIVHGIEGPLKAGERITPEQVDQVADQVVSSKGSNPSDSEIEQKLENAPFHKGSSLSLRDAGLFKVILSNIDSNDIDKPLPLEKRAGFLSGMFRLGGMKTFTSSVLSKILSWIVKTVLISCGFMAVGAFVDHLMGKAPGASGSSSFAPSGETEAIALAPSKQQVFKVNPSYANEALNVSSGWIEGVPPSQIGNQIVAWAEEIYPDLRGKEDVIRNSQLFQATVRMIQQYNVNNTSQVTFMPKFFTSRKNVIDAFVDEVANKIKALPASPSKPVPIDE